MRKYWIKLWLDFLEDAKLLPLDEVYQLRFLKLCLLSAKLELNGMLPPVETIAFWLRLTLKQVDQTMSILSKCGVVSGKSDGSWFIVNFQNRQEALSGTDRARLSRLRNKDATKLQRNGNETLQDSVPLSSVSSPISDSSPLKPGEDSLNSKIEESFKGADFRFYEENIGILTPMIAESIQDAQDEYPSGWIEGAIREAARVNKRSWGYCEAILKRWKVDGPGPENNGKKPALATGKKPETALERARREYEHAK